MQNGKRTHQRTVVVADDNPKALALVLRILELRYKVMAQGADGEALVEAVTRLQPDAAIVDIAMPILNGIEAVERFRPTSRTAVVYLTAQNEPVLIRKALAAGGLGYVLKAAAAEDLIPAIEAALIGKTFLSPSLE